MSDAPAPTGEKEYWHDKSLGTARAAASSPRPGPDRQSADTRASPVVTPSPVKTYPNLRHPIAAFVKLVVSFRLPMVRLTLPPWEGSSLQHSFGNKPLVDHKGRGRSRS